MATKLRFKVNTQEFVDALRDAVTKIEPVIEKMLQTKAQEAVDLMRQTISGPTTTSRAIAYRSGDLSAALGYRLERKGKNFIVTLGVLSDNPTLQATARTHEHGAEIVPVSAQKLAFPPSDAGYPIRDSRGVQVMSVRDASESYQLTFLTNVILGREYGADRSENRIFFIRKDRVVIPSRPFVGPAVAQFEDEVRSYLSATP